MKRIDERTELKSDFNLVSTRDQDHPAWPHFRRAMRDKQYGRGPLNQAWSFYKEGWDAALAPSKTSELNAGKGGG